MTILQFTEAKPKPSVSSGSGFEPKIWTIQTLATPVPTPVEPTMSCETVSVGCQSGLVYLQE